MTDNNPNNEIEEAIKTLATNLDVIESRLSSLEAAFRHHEHSRIGNVVIKYRI